jgi:hypothetical protein
MKKHLALALAAGFSALALPSASANLSLSINDGVGDPAAITLVPGASFSFTLNLTSTAESIQGLGFSFEVSAPGSGLFTITARDLTDTAFPDVATPNGTLLIPANAVLDPTPGTPAGNELDLGGLTDNLTLVGPGTFEVADFTFLVPGSAAPGVYTIETIMNIATDENFDTLPVAPATYTVTVVPEPGACGLLALGSLALAARRRRG